MPEREPVEVTGLRPKLADVVKELKPGAEVYVLKEDGSVYPSVTTTWPRLERSQWMIGVAGIYGAVALDRVTPR
jgi:hypothetical protein